MEFTGMSILSIGDRGKLVAANLREKNHIMLPQWTDDTLEEFVNNAKREVVIVVGDELKESHKMIGDENLIIDLTDVHIKDIVKFAGTAKQKKIDDVIATLAKGIYMVMDEAPTGEVDLVGIDMMDVQYLADQTEFAQSPYGMGIVSGLDAKKTGEALAALLKSTPRFEQVSGVLLCLRGDVGLADFHELLSEAEEAMAGAFESRKYLPAVRNNPMEDATLVYFLF